MDTFYFESTGDWDRWGEEIERRIEMVIERRVELEIARREEERNEIEFQYWLEENRERIEGEIRQEKLQPSPVQIVNMNQVVPSAPS